MTNHLRTAETFPHKPGDKLEPPLYRSGLTVGQSIFIDHPEMAQTVRGTVVGEVPVTGIVRIRLDGTGDLVEVPMAMLREASHWRKRADFLDRPHETLYPVIWDGLSLRPEAKSAFLERFFETVEPSLPDIRDYVHFVVIGSGACYNWDEVGDFDIQVWISDESLVPEVRDIIVSELLDLTCVDFGLDGTMGIQYYAKPGGGTPEENLAGQPYACYDIDADSWVVEPFPLTPEMYGDMFLLVESRANEIAHEADSLLFEYELARRDFEFWSALAVQSVGYEDMVSESSLDMETSWNAAKAFFHQLMLMRKRAYEPGGKGIKDDRDAIWKLMEVWGVIQRLKTLSHGEPGVVVGVRKTSKVASVSVQSGSPLDYHHPITHRFFVSAEPVEGGNPYFAGLPLGAFADVWEKSDEVYLAYISVRPDLRGLGFARELMEHIYAAFPGKKVDWGRIMDDGIEKLWREFKETHPDRGNWGKVSSTWRGFVKDNEPFWKWADFVIATTRAGRGRYYEVYVHGEAWRNFPRLDDAKSALISEFGSLEFAQHIMEPVVVDTMAWGQVDWFTDPQVLYLSDL